jgi:hypothetical protein
MGINHFVKKKKQYFDIRICCIFNDTRTNADYIGSNDWVIVNNAFEWLWKEAVVAYLNILSSHLPGQAEENNEKPQSEYSMS